MAELPLKICCIVSSLAAGGAERVITLLANQWAARGRLVTIVTSSAVTGDAYRLDPRIRRVGLNLEKESRSLAQAIRLNLLKIRDLRRAVARLEPDVVISFVDRMNVLTLLACTGLGIPIIISERVHPEYYDIGRIWSALRRLTYAFADALVVQSHAIRHWATGIVPARRTHVIPNPVGDEFSTVKDDSQVARRRVVLGVGRLVPQKGFDLLIKAFHSAVQHHPEWSLIIIGQGPEEGKLKRLAVELLPRNPVDFRGTVTDPETYYRTAGLFVLSSRFEGFPNALLEAMASGCAVIASNCPGATQEIVRDGVDGSVVPAENVDALAREMDRLMADESTRSRLGAQAVLVASRFRVARVTDLWESAIADVRRKL